MDKVVILIHELSDCAAGKQFRGKSEESSQSSLDVCAAPTAFRKVLESQGTISPWL